MTHNSRSWVFSDKQLTFNRGESKSALEGSDDYRVDIGKATVLVVGLGNAGNIKWETHDDAALHRSRWISAELRHDMVWGGRGRGDEREGEGRDTAAAAAKAAAGAGAAHPYRFMKSAGSFR